MEYYYLQKKDKAIHLSRTTNVHKLPELLRHTTELLLYISSCTEPLMYTKKTRAQNSKNQPEPLLPTKSLNRSSNQYKCQEVLRPTFIQNHFSLQMLDAIKAYK